jgi:hypothetical protein
MFKEKTTQREIILDWIPQIFTECRTQADLVKRCVDRYGEDIFYEHQVEIIESWNRHLNKKITNVVVV